MKATQAKLQLPPLHKTDRLDSSKSASKSIPLTKTWHLDDPSSDFPCLPESVFAPDAHEDRNNSNACQPKDSNHNELHTSTAIPRQVSIVAGVAIAVTAGTFSQIIHQSPEYEGTFELAAQPGTTNTEPTVSPQIEEVNQPITETQLRILQSPRLLEPIIEQLKDEDPEFDYHHFIQNLDLTIDSHQQLEVSYRDLDPARVKLVLEQLAQIYVEYSQECQNGTCKGLRFVEAQIPQVQQRVDTLRNKIQQFHQEYGLKNLEGQVQLITNRSTEVAKQSADIQVKLAEARQQYQDLQARLALKPEETIAKTLLQQDQRYQVLLQQFQLLDSRLTQALSTAQASDPALQTLTNQHQQLVAQMHNEAMQVLPRKLADPDANLQDPIYQEPQLLELLQQSIRSTHFIQLLEIRQQTLEQAQQLLDRQKQEMANFLRSYADLRQQLQSETQILQQYIDKRDLLRAQISQQEDIEWKVVSAPALLRDSSGQPVADYFHNLKQDAASAAILGMLLGLAVAIVQEEKRRKRTSPMFGIDSAPTRISPIQTTNQRDRALLKQVMSQNKLSNSTRQLRVG